MSLKNLEVHNLLAKNFVCAWRNTEGDPDAGRSNRHPCGSGAMELGRGTGKANVQSLVLTPCGKIISAMSGYISARDLLWELEQALHTWRQLRPLLLPAGDRRAMGRNAGKETDPAAVVRRRIHEMNDAEDKEREMLKGNAGLENNPQLRGLLSSWKQSIVRADRAFVSKNPLMPIEDFRTRMLTGGQTAAFGYHVSKLSDHRGAGTMTYEEFQELPKTLQKQFMKHVPDAFHGDPTMVSTQSLPKRLRKSIDKRLKRIRKRLHKKASLK